MSINLNGQLGASKLSVKWDKELAAPLRSRESPSRGKEFSNCKEESALSLRIEHLTRRMTSFERHFANEVEKIAQNCNCSITKKEFLFNPNKLDWSNYTEIIPVFFEYLDLRDVAAVSRVCSRWNRTAKSDSICKELLQRINPIEFALIADMRKPFWSLQLQSLLTKRALSNKIDQYIAIQKERDRSWIFISPLLLPVSIIVGVFLS